MKCEKQFLKTLYVKKELGYCCLFLLGWMVSLNIVFGIMAIKLLRCYYTFNWCILIIKSCFSEQDELEVKVGLGENGTVLTKLNSVSIVLGIWPRHFHT